MTEFILPEIEHSPYWDEYINETAAADFLELSPRTLQQYRRSGVGPIYQKFSRCVRYTRRTLQAWALEQTPLKFGHIRHG